MASACAAPAEPISEPSKIADKIPEIPNPAENLVAPTKTPDLSAISATPVSTAFPAGPVSPSLNKTEPFLVNSGVTDNSDRISNLSQYSPQPHNSVDTSALFALIAYVAQQLAGQLSNILAHNALAAAHFANASVPYSSGIIV